MKVKNGSGVSFCEGRKEWNQAKKGWVGEEEKKGEEVKGVTQSVVTLLSVGAPGRRHEALTWNSK